MAVEVESVRAHAKNVDKDVLPHLRQAAAAAEQSTMGADFGPIGWLLAQALHGDAQRRVVEALGTLVTEMTATHGDLRNASTEYATVDSGLSVGLQFGGW